MPPIFVKNLSKGVGNSFCVICDEYIKQFIPHGNPPRAKAKCPQCNSLERHRFSWKYIQTEIGDIPSRSNILHICPEESIGSLLRKIGIGNYYSLNLNLKYGADHSALTNLQIQDNFFDLVYCAHVLEYVQEDTKALSEIYRTLKPGKIAIFLVPTKDENTFEDPNANTPELRIQAYGQPNRIRSYGKTDFLNKLISVGFSAKIVNATDIVSESELKTFGIKKKFLYSATKV